MQEKTALLPNGQCTVQSVTIFKYRKLICGERMDWLSASVLNQTLISNPTRAFEERRPLPRRIRSEAGAK